MVDDPRIRQIVLLTNNTVGLQAADMLKPDGVTPLVTHVMYAVPEIPLIWLFNGLGNEALFTLETPSTAHLEAQPQTAGGRTYAYREVIPIVIYTKDSDTVAGRLARWQCEAELRRVVEANYGGNLGALRRFDKITDAEKDMGGWRLYSIKYELEYKRANDNYLPTYPTVDYGVGWCYDGNRLAGGTEGTWSVAGTGATQAIEYTDFLAVTRTTNDAASTNGTSLNLSTSIYTKIRFRYKCSNSSVNAQIIVNFSSGYQVVLAKTNTTTLMEATVSLTTAKTVTTIALEADDAAGTVYYDFVEIYQDNYILPNCTKLSPPQILEHPLIPIPYHVAGRSQTLGAEPIKIAMTCDLDVECAALTWMRPQTQVSKSDKIKLDCLEQIHHEEAANTAPWHWVNWGKGACKMNLTKLTPTYGVDNSVDLEFTEKRLSSASCAHENYRTRFSLDQIT